MQLLREIETAFGCPTAGNQRCYLIFELAPTVIPSVLRRDLPQDRRLCVSLCQECRTLWAMESYL